MKDAFDKHAAGYDAAFSATEAGRLYRARVHEWLLKRILLHPEKEVLDLNCGTGEDALFLGRAGHRVTALDRSSGMIRIASEKCAGLPLVTCSVADLHDLPGMESERRYDLVLSNFGGFNCLGPEALAKVTEAIARLLKPGGHLVAIVMPRYALWEILYFLLRAKPKQAFRRSRGFAGVCLEGLTVPTWYYAPGEFTGIAGRHFSKVSTRPLGAILPPASSGHGPVGRMISSFAGLLERFAWYIPFLSAVSDHYLTDLTTNLKPESDG
jgi:ubiquinone/menaquinone biosynthesis C-methylase UbiE